MATTAQIIAALSPGDNFMPESPAVTAPIAGEGPSVPVPASAAPAKSKGGLLGALGRIFTPDAGTFWDSAWKNGLVGARSGQQQYQSAMALATQKAQAEIALKQAEAAKAARVPAFQIAGNNVVTAGADGQPVITAPPASPDANTKLYDLWRNTLPESPERKFVEALALKSNDTSVIAAKAQAQAGTAEARAKATAKYRAPPRASTAGMPPLPPGFRIK